MRFTWKMTVVTMALGFLVGCPDVGGGDGGEPACTSDLDCDGLDQCHPTLNVCVPDCTQEGETCPAFAPVCNGPDADGAYPLELVNASADPGYRAICVCTDDASCPDGQVCSTEFQECVTGETGETGCTDIGDCGDGEICDDGECVVPEDECTVATEYEDCVPTGGFCDDTDNMCYPAEEFTANCTDADSAPGQSGPPHIVIDSMDAPSTRPQGR
jgi:hypothetical protein